MHALIPSLKRKLTFVSPTSLVCLLISLAKDGDYHQNSFDLRYRGHVPGPPRKWHAVLLPCRSHCTHCSEKTNPRHHQGESRSNVEQLLRQPRSTIHLSWNRSATILPWQHSPNWSCLQPHANVAQHVRVYTLQPSTSTFYIVITYLIRLTIWYLISVEIETLISVIYLNKITNLFWLPWSRILDRCLISKILPNFFVSIAQLPGKLGQLKTTQDV